MKLTAMEDLFCLNLIFSMMCNITVFLENITWVHK